jgi:hypothetical protein
MSMTYEYTVNGDVDGVQDTIQRARASKGKRRRGIKLSFSLLTLCFWTSSREREGWLHYTAHISDSVDSGSSLIVWSDIWYTRTQVATPHLYIGNSTGFCQR